MKSVAIMVLAAIAAVRLSADATMHEKITAALADSDHSPQPPPTAKEMSRRLPPKRNDFAGEPVVTLPDYEVVAPRSVVPNQPKIELALANIQVAVRQEEAQAKATEIDKVLSNDSFQYEIGPVTFAFGYDSAGERAAAARDRLKVLDLQQTVVLTGLATSEEDRKELDRLMARLKAPTQPAFMKRQ